MLETVLRSLDLISERAYNKWTERDPSENWWNYRIGGPLHLPPVAPPAGSVMEARAPAADVADEMRRLIGSLNDHLAGIGEQVGAMEPRRASGRGGAASSSYKRPDVQACVS